MSLNKLENQLRIAVQTADLNEVSRLLDIMTQIKRSGVKA